MPFIIFVEGLLVVSCMLCCYSIGFGRSLLTIRLSRCAPLSKKSFANNKALEAHRAIHKEEEVFECKMCGERFMKLKEYEKHCLNEGELEMCTMLRQVCRSPIAQETCVFQFS